MIRCFGIITFLLRNHNFLHRNHDVLLRNHDMLLRNHDLLLRNLHCDGSDSRRFASESSIIQIYRYHGEKHLIYNMCTLKSNVLHDVDIHFEHKKLFLASMSGIIRGVSEKSARLSKHIISTAQKQIPTHCFGCVLELVKENSQPPHNPKRKLTKRPTAKENCSNTFKTNVSRLLF